MSKVIVKTIQSVEEMIAVGAYIYGSSSNVVKVDDYKEYANNNNKQTPENMIHGFIFTNAEGLKCITFDETLVVGDAEKYPYKIGVMHNLTLKAIAKKVNPDKEFLSTIKLSREELFGINKLTPEQLLKFPLGTITDRLTPVYTVNVDSGGTGRATNKGAAAGAKSNDALFKSVIEAEKKATKKKRVEAESLKGLSTSEVQDFHRRKTEQEVFRDSDYMCELNSTNLPKVDEFKWVDTIELRSIDNGHQSWRYVDNAKNPSGNGNAGIDSRIPFGIGGVDKVNRKLTLVIGITIDEAKAKELGGRFIQSEEISKINIHTDKLASYLETNWCFYSQSNYKIFGIEYK